MIDFTKPVQTRDGREVQIYTRNHPGDQPVVGAALNSKGLWRVMQWNADGSFYPLGRASDSNDLVNAPAKFRHEVWVNVYPGSVSNLHDSKEMADAHAVETRIAIKRIVIAGTEGDEE